MATDDSVRWPPSGPPWARRLPGPTRVLTGAEDVVSFMPGQAFSADGHPEVTQAWLRGRLRLDPAASPFDLDAGIYVFLDDVFLDLAFDAVVPTGPHDGLVAWLEDLDYPGWECARAVVRGEWLRTSIEDVEDQAEWIGASPELDAVAMSWAQRFADSRDSGGDLLLRTRRRSYLLLGPRDEEADREEALLEELAARPNPCDAEEQGRS